MCVIRREFVRGKRVVIRAEIIEVAIDLFRTTMLAALEHHVFKKVRHAHEFRRFIASACSHKEANGGGVGQRINLCLDLESVREASSAVHVGSRHVGRCRGHGTPDFVAHSLRCGVREIGRLVP